MHLYCYLFSLNVNSLHKASTKIVPFSSRWISVGHCCVFSEGYVFHVICCHIKDMLKRIPANILDQYFERTVAKQEVKLDE